MIRKRTDNDNFIKPLQTCNGVLWQFSDNGENNNLVYIAHRAASNCTRFDVIRYKARYSQIKSIYDTTAYCQESTILIFRFPIALGQCLNHVPKSSNNI